MIIQDLLYNTFIKGFENKQRSFIGTELEFPLVNLAKAPVKESVCLGLMEHLCDNGFEPQITDVNGNPIFVENKKGDVLSFDNSYNNFEFSMAKDEDLVAVSKRFYIYFDLVQGYLEAHNHSLSGMGTNLYKDYTTQSPVAFPTYSMVESFLRRSNGASTHGLYDFPAYMSSAQTHLDVPIDRLPQAATLFARMDFVRAMLFSNSLSFIKGFEKAVCFRDYLWEKRALRL